MKIVITGPRSVGKTTISKILAKKLNLKYISTDEIGEKYTQEYEGLDKAIKSGKINEFIREKGFTLIISTFESNKDFVLDLLGGSITSRKFKEQSRKLRNKIKRDAIIVGLLPSKNSKESIEFLFNREKNRKHFRKTNEKELFEKVKKDYLKFPKILKQFCNKIIYVQDKNKEEIMKEIGEFLNAPPNS